MRFLCLLVLILVIGTCLALTADKDVKLNLLCHSSYIQNCPVCKQMLCDNETEHSPADIAKLSMHLPPEFPLARMLEDSKQIPPTEPSKIPVIIQNNSAPVVSADLVSSDWGPWTPFGPCSVTCGAGKVTRTRQCPHVPGKAPCNGSSTESKDCSLEPCKKTSPDGQWTPWGDYTSCTETCGSQAVQIRRRICSVKGGKGCVGPDAETKKCPVPACPESSIKCTSQKYTKDDGKKACIIDLHKQLNFEEAQTECIMAQSGLPVIRSQKENQAIMKLIPDKTLLSLMFDSKQYLWIDNSATPTQATFLNWQSDTKSDLQTNACATIDAETGKWQHVVCEDQFPVACEHVFEK